MSGAEKINPGSGRGEWEGVLLVFVVIAGGMLQRKGVKKGDKKYRQTEVVFGGQPECKQITWEVNVE